MFDHYSKVVKFDSKVVKFARAAGVAGRDGQAPVTAAISCLTATFDHFDIVVKHAGAAGVAGRDGQAPAPPRLRRPHTPRVVRTSPPPEV